MIRRLRFFLLLMGLSLGVIHQPVWASPGSSDSEVAGWRTDGSGIYPNASPPTVWSRGMNVVWRASLGGWSNATPTVVGSSIFVTVEPLKLVCVNASDGTVKWEATHDYSEIEQTGDLPHAHKITGWASPTPTVADGRVVALFGNGVAASYGMDGDRQWIQLIDKPTRGWGQSASPLLVDGQAVFAINDLIAVDASTGKAAWRIPSKPSWGSPISTEIGDVAVIVTCAGQIVRAADGKVLADNLAELEFNAPIIVDRNLYFMTHEATAYRLPDAMEPGKDGRISVERLWKGTLKRERYYSSPVVFEDKIYSITRTRILTVLDAKTGKEVEETRLGRRGAEMYSSITVAGGYLYITSEDGRTFVVKPSDELTIVGQNRLRSSRSCPVFVGDKMFMRAGNDLYCICASSEES